MNTFLLENQETILNVCMCVCWNERGFYGTATLTAHPNLTPTRKLCRVLWTRSLNLIQLNSSMPGRVLAPPRQIFLRALTRAIRPNFTFCLIESLQRIITKIVSIRRRINFVYGGTDDAKEVWTTSSLTGIDLFFRVSIEKEKRAPTVARKFPAFVSEINPAEISLNYVAYFS